MHEQLFRHEHQKEVTTSLIAKRKLDNARRSPLDKIKVDEGKVNVKVKSKLKSKSKPLFSPSEIGRGGRLTRFGNTFTTNVTTK
jgi:hypothetical protein